jgi:hypothetical protein
MPTECRKIGVNGASILSLFRQRKWCDPDRVKNTHSAKTNSHLDPFPESARFSAAEPDFSGFDSAADLLRDAAKWGLLDDLRAMLCGTGQNDDGDKLRIARDIGYELAGAKNRDFAVDLFIHVTGIAEFGPASLREYGRKHGCTHEWFRREAEKMRKRLDLPLLPSQRSEDVRAVYRLVNRRNDGAQSH